MVKMMETATVKFFAALRDIAGKREMKVRLPRKKTTVLEILEDLSKALGKEFRDYMFEGRDCKSTRSQVSIMINGQSIRNLENLNTMVRDNDVIAILPPISGG
ncbi:MAG: ubiquitin-like small modifier protein 1 [Candidatus Atabeyarchaeum deiterrae]